MEGQDTTIRLMGTIIELQDELRYYQGGFEKKMIKHLEQMEKKIMERNEEIGNNILKTVCEKMATIKQQVDNIEPAMDKKFDRMMEQLTFQLSQNVHLTANIDPMPYYNIKTWDSDDEWEVDKNGKKTDTLQQLTQGQEQGQGLARTDDQPINEDGNAAPLEHGEKSLRARRVTRALVDYEEPKKLDKDDEQQPSDDVGPKRKKLKNDIGQQTDLENKWRQFAKSFKRKGKIVRKCTKCGKVIRGNTANLRKHIEGQHLMVPYPCPHCSFVGRYKQNLTNHIKSLHPEVRFACPQCPYIAVQATSLTYHLATIHRATQPQPGVINNNGQSGQVDGEGETPECNLEDFVKTVEVDGTKFYECAKCDKVLTDTKANLKRHIKAQHLGVFITCAHCPYVARSTAYLINHTKSRHPEVRFKCPDCPYTTRLARSLNYHLATVYHEKRDDLQAEMADELGPGLGGGGGGDQAGGDIGPGHGGQAGGDLGPGHGGQAGGDLGPGHGGQADGESLARKENWREFVKSYYKDGMKLYECTKCDQAQSYAKRALRAHIKRHLSSVDTTPEARPT